MTSLLPSPPRPRTSQHAVSRKVNRHSRHRLGLRQHCLARSQLAADQPDATAIIACEQKRGKPSPPPPPGDCSRYRRQVLLQNTAVVCWMDCSHTTVAAAAAAAAHKTSLRPRAAAMRLVRSVPYRSMNTHHNNKTKQNKRHRTQHNTTQHIR